MTGIFPTMFDFSAHELTYGEHGWYDSKPIEFKKWRDTLFASQLKLQKAGFAVNIIENHDEPRGASLLSAGGMQEMKPGKRCWEPHPFCSAASRLSIRDRRSA